jgi:hypothetical protein
LLTAAPDAPPLPPAPPAAFWLFWLMTNGNWVNSNDGIAGLLSICTSGDSPCRGLTGLSRKVLT